jgi:hypothetical protein
MKRSLRVMAAGIITAGIILGGTACAASDGSDVLQYGDYDSMHVYHTYPQPIIVHVTRKVYMSNTTMYSNPTVERTYVSHHTCRTTTTRTNGRTTSVRQCS